MLILLNVASSCHTPQPALLLSTPHQLLLQAFHLASIPFSFPLKHSAACSGSHQELYTHDAHIWTSPRSKPYDCESGRPKKLGTAKPGIERTQLQKQITALKHNRREILGQGAVADMSRSEIEQWKSQFEAAQEGPQDLNAIHDD
jgi:hypothetical protein